MVEAATARIAPGPHDDPAEQGHPGAREAGVTGYIDTCSPPSPTTAAVIFAGGPWSNQAHLGPDLMASFTALDPWRRSPGASG